MIIVFLSTLLAGILLAVVAMLSGVERARVGLSERVAALAGSGKMTRQVAAEVSAHYWLPLLAAFAVAFGMAGYIATRYTDAGTLGATVAGALAGGAVATGAVMLVAQWAVPAARRDPEDERFILQGQIGQVSAAISGPELGKVVLELDGTVFTMSATSVDGSAIPPGMEVAIDRVEHGIAYVEPWAQVERRL